MKTKRLKLFSYPELSDKAKTAALQSWITNNPDWADYGHDVEQIGLLLAGNPICKKTAVFTRSGQYFNEDDLN